MNAESLQIVKSQKYLTQFQKPLYSQYAFSCLPSTVQKLLIGHGENSMADAAMGGAWGPYDAVVLFLIDGFGWEFFQAYLEKYPLLKRISQTGVVSMISSSFPSTTAAHLTSLHTGSEIGQTGIYEWFQYEPIVDQMVAHLPLSYAGDPCNDRLPKEGYPTSQLFPFETIYSKWNKKGIRSFALQHEKIAHSEYSKAMFQGAELLPFTTWKEGLNLASSLLKQPFQEPLYLFAYWGDIDSAGHRQGICSAAFDDAVKECLTSLEEQFLPSIAGIKKKIALLFTADHGMVKVDPKKILYLNELCPELEGMVQKNRQGNLLLPAGSCRDFFLHIQPASLHLAKELLKRKLEGKAEVIETARLIQDGIFGSPEVSTRFLERVGNLAILPYLQESVFWKFRTHRFDQHFLAAHGGMTEQEMQSIFLTYIH